MNNILFLVLENHINKVVVRVKIHINQSFIREVLVLCLFNQLHIVIVHTYIVIVAVIFVNKKIITHFTHNLKIHSSGIFFIGLGINNALGGYGACGNHKNYR